MNCIVLKFITSKKAFSLVYCKFTASLQNATTTLLQLTTILPQVTTCLLQVMTHSCIHIATTLQTDYNRFIASDYTFTTSCYNLVQSYYEVKSYDRFITSCFSQATKFITSLQLITTTLWGGTASLLAPI